MQRKSDFECQTKDMMVALNAKLWGNDEGKIAQCGVSSQISIRRKGLKETPGVSKDAPLTSQNGQINYKIKSHNPSD